MRPNEPASAMIDASSASFFAFSTTHSSPASRSFEEIRSDSATSSVPTRIGRPVSWTVLISSTIASSFCSSVA